MESLLKVKQAGIAAWAALRELSGDDALKMQKILDALDDLDDVQDVYTSALIDD